MCSGFFFLFKKSCILVGTVISFNSSSRQGLLFYITFSPCSLPLSASHSLPSFMRAGGWIIIFTSIYSSFTLSLFRCFCTAGTERVRVRQNHSLLLSSEFSYVLAIRMISMSPPFCPPHCPVIAIPPCPGNATTIYCYYRLSFSNFCTDLFFKTRAILLYISGRRPCYSFYSASIFLRSTDIYALQVRTICMQLAPRA